MSRRRTKNKFQRNANKKKMMNNITQTLPTKGNIKNSAIESGKDLLIGVVAGGFAGSAIGRPSLIVGFLTSGIGHYLDNKLLTSAGLGMMASNSFMPKSVQGFEGVEGLEGLEGVKERVQAFKESLTYKVYLDKVKGFKMSKPKAVSGMGEVQYFSYPNNMLEGAGDELAFLNQIENQIANTALPVSGLDAVEYEEAIY
jgi:hypothetical protein